MGEGERDKRWLGLHLLHHAQVVQVEGLLVVDEQHIHAQSTHARTVALGPTRACVLPLAFALALAVAADAVTDAVGSAKRRRFHVGWGCRCRCRRRHLSGGDVGGVVWVQQV